jgi:hypothetical protein
MMAFFTKSVLALVLAASALFALFTMLELMGRKEKKFNPKILRALHRINGAFFFLFFMFISYYCIKIMRGIGQELSVRATLHSLLSIATFLILCLKLLVIRFYRQYFSMAVPLGICVVLLALGTTATSAGYYFAMRGKVSVESSSSIQDKMSERGAIVFNKKCSDCHYTDKAETKIGPGLKGLFKQNKLPASGKPPTDENIRKQLKSPFNVMPSFQDLSEEEVESLVVFLKSL